MNFNWFKTIGKRYNKHGIAYSNKHFNIPQKNRLIAIRVNFGENSPNTNIKFWAHSGSMFCKNEKGLYAVSVDQNPSIIKIITEFAINPTFHILEIDKRDIINQNETIPNAEIAFKKCNILFYGDITNFFVELKKHTNPVEFKNIHNVIKNNLKELSITNESPAQILERSLKLLRKSETIYNNFYSRRI